jgi:glutathione reductase (NADPH)
MPGYDLVVLGAGNAGLAAANVARRADWSVAIFESRDVGGVCPLRGCVPKKVLVAAAETMDAIARAARHGIQVGPARLDWARLIARKETFVEGVPDEIQKGLESSGIDVYAGAGRFAGPRTIDYGEGRIEARKILIATGSRPRQLPIEGAQLLITSDDILTREERPDSIVFVGAGVVGLEFAHVFARAGTKVTLLEVMDRPLPEMDPDAVARLVGATADAGIDLITGVEVRAVQRAGNGVSVRFNADGKEQTLNADVAANGAGRVPNLDGLGLESAGVELDDGTPRLDEFCRSLTNTDVFFAGDALSGSPQLSPVASYEGKIVGRNIVSGQMTSPDYRTIPSCVFTIPPLAQVGFTEDRATDAGRSFDVVENDMASWRSARTYAEDTAYAKILVEKDTGLVLGAHLVGHGAPETIHFFATAMAADFTVDRIRETVFAYPTFHADLKNLV